MLDLTTANRPKKRSKARDHVYTARNLPVSTLDSQNGRHKRLLLAVNLVAFRLFSQEEANFNHTVEESLEILAGSVNAERCAIWKNYSKNDNLRIRRLAVWNNPELEKILFRQIVDPVPGDLSINEILPEWQTIMEDQSPLFVIDKNLQEPFRSLALYNGIRSVLIIPIFSRGFYWGFITFMNYREERFYSTLEQELLRTGGILIASAVENNEQIKELTQACSEARANAVG